MSERHTFAFYYPTLSQAIETNKALPELIINDKALWQRLVRIVRLDDQELCVIFDGRNVLHGKFGAGRSSKSPNLVFSIVSIAQSTQLAPSVTVCPALLKRESFEEVIYMAAQMGANIIQPIIAEKSHRPRDAAQMQERLERIVIAACEQSKNFSIPTIKQPIMLETFFEQQNSVIISKKIICFDPNGSPLLETLQDIHANNYNNLLLLWGPEGDFTQHERDIMKNNQISFTALTPTILRSVEAFAVGLGSIRSVRK